MSLLADGSPFVLACFVERSNKEGEMEHDEEALALDEWAKADPNRMTREEALAEGRGSAAHLIE